MNAKGRVLAVVVVVGLCVLSGVLTGCKPQMNDDPSPTNIGGKRSDTTSDPHTSSVHVNGQGNGNGNNGDPPPAPTSSAPAVLRQFRYNARGEKLKEDTMVQYGLWTPSLQTRGFFQDGSAEPGGSHYWQNLQGDKGKEKIEKYGRMLSERHGVLGWRRYEAYGKGNISSKPGWRWVITVDERQFKPDELAREYFAFWGQPTRKPDKNHPNQKVDEDVYLERLAGG